jgi:hypothetical protein
VINAECSEAEDDGSTVSFGGEAPPFEFSTSTRYTLTVG